MEMTKAAKSPARQSLFNRLASGTDEGAAAELFVMLCRNSPELREWLWDDFARDAGTREAFALALRRAKSTAVTRFADLSGDGNVWHDTARELRARLHGPIHGGLTRRQIEALIVRYQAGQTDLAAYLLARQWARLRQGSRIPPRLLRSAVLFLDAALHGGDVSLLHHLGKAARLNSAGLGRTERRALTGYSDWWKLHALHFILHHPAPAYRTRDLAAHLRSLGLTVQAKELRRFLTRHNLRRDMRAGRPRTRGAAAAPERPTRSRAA